MAEEDEQPDELEQHRQALREVMARVETDLAFLGVELRTSWNGVDGQVQAAQGHLMQAFEIFHAIAD